MGHGCANALLIPYVARHNAVACVDRYAEAYGLLGGASDGWPRREAAFALAELLEELVMDLELPCRLSELKAGIEERHFDDMADRAMAVARPMENNPRVMDKRACVAIYKEAY